MVQQINHFFKRWLAMLSLVSAFVCMANAESVKIGDLYYELNTTNRTATLTYENNTTSNYSSLSASMTIPDKVTYNGIAFSVTNISDRAFANCRAIESISIPGSVTAIGTTTPLNAGDTEGIYLPFYNCTNLKSIRFEDGVNNLVLTWHNYSRTSITSYNRGMFYSCPLEEVYIGRNIEYKAYSTYPFEDYPQSYGYSAFYNQPKLTKVTIGDKVTEIPAYLFYNCTALAHVDFGKSLISIPKYAFKSCTLKTIELPNTMSYIAEYAFDFNTELNAVNIGSSVQTIGNYAFNNCVLLSDIKLGQKLTTIGDYAFASAGKSATTWTPIVFPETLTTIGESAFSSSGCRSITIPNTVSSIGESAFASNTNLRSITFGSGCKILPVSVLNGCTALIELNLSHGIETICDKAFANCSAIESISIPGSVTAIGTTTPLNSGDTEGIYLPFYNCTNLKSIRFEDGVNNLVLTWHNYSRTSISSYNRGMFYSCPLEEVYIGRNIEYKANSTYPFENYPQSYGYSAFYNQPKLTKVTIGDAVTDIPAYLFYNCASITLMTLPNVKNIGTAAFRECSKLTTLNLGRNLVNIGNEAFYGCTNVTKLTFPNTTQSIGNSAFYNCSSVTEVTVGTGLKSIGSYGFYGCKSFTALILPDTFVTMGESAFEGCNKLTVAKLGNSLTAVPAKAFKNCPSLSEMVIPASAKSLGDQALYNDSGLATITMNEGLETIGNEVFWNNSGVMQFSIPGTVTSMGKNCFYGCTRVTYLTFRDGTETLAINNSGTLSSVIDAKTTDSSYRNRKYDYFYDCPIRFLTLGRNLTYSYSASESIYDIDGTRFKQVRRASAPFVNSTELRSVTIGPKVTFLYHHLFDGCANLATLRMGRNIETIYTYAFNNCDKLSGVDFPESLQRIDNYAFNNCDILSSTTYKESSSHNLSINDAAFKDCISLTEVTLPGQLDKLGNSSYSNCPVLKTVIFNDNKSYQPSLTIGNYTFADCTQITSLSFPGRLASIGNYTFRGCNYLTHLEFQDSNSAVSLGYGAASTSGNDLNSLPLFGNCNLESLYLGRNIDYNSTSTYGYSPFYNQAFLTDVKFSDAGTVTYCLDYLLYKVNSCETLILPESLKTIGNYTFASMTALEGIIIPNKVTEIGKYAFSNDLNLKYAHLSSSCSWLKEGLFNSCDSLGSITIPPIVTKMDTKMFANCKSLTSATFEGSSDILEMGYGASQTEKGLFSDCPLETLTLDRWLLYNTEVSSRSPFYSIAALKNLTLGANVGVVDKYMFSYCTGFEEVYLPDNIESVGLWGFRGCSALKSVRFSENLSQVSDYGFSECTSLDNVVFPASMTSVADNSFSNCTSLKKLDLGNKLMIIGPAAFKNDTSLEGVEIPTSLYGLGVEAFANCTSLPSIKIQGISSVGMKAFEGCTGLQWVSLSDKTTSLGENSFAGCSGIKYVKSYAEFPPEGLVNFIESVPANGTLFVPEYSLDYYQYSPTWENWSDIRPINENILVSSVALDRSELSFKANETAQLSATVGAEDATDKSILWRTSDEAIAIVDATGLVTAVAVGDAIITALAADGSGIKAECMVTVIPTMVESISINAANTSLKKDRTLDLTASVLPATATNSNVVWSSSDSNLVAVDEDGVVTAIKPGEVQITATAADGSGIYALFTLTVIPPMAGDSNDNDAVTITDAVNTANYAVGNEVADFCFEAADVDGNGRVTLSDASATVRLVLEQPAMTSPARIRAMATTELLPDCLVIDDYSAGEECTIGVRLENKVDYVAMQADIVVPDGMEIVNVSAGTRAEVFHSVVTKQICDNVVRVALFDFDNNTFADNTENLLELTVRSKRDTTGSIVMTNALGSDGRANEYVLTSTGGNNAVLSGIDAVLTAGNITVKGEGDAVVVYNAEHHDIAVYTADGMLIKHVNAVSNIEKIALAPGMYVVAVENVVEKLFIK